MPIAPLESEAVRHLENLVAAPVIGSVEFAELLSARCASAKGMSLAINAILERPFAAHTVETLASAAGMSRSAFAQRFTDLVGQAPIEFLKYERLRHAAHLLYTTSLPLKSIIGTVGYSSRSYFSRAFRSAFALSPGTVRRARMTKFETPKTLLCL